MSHSKEHFVLFVPHWIARTLDREKVNYSKLLNLTESKKHFSAEELSILYWLNKENALFKGMDGERGLYMYPQWASKDEEYSYVFNLLEPMKDIALQAIQARLGAAGASEPIPENGFKIVTLPENTLVFVVILYAEPDAAQSAALSAALLKLLYAHTGYDDMARSHFFKGYIERLALANNAL